MLRDAYCAYYGINDPTAFFFPAERFIILLDFCENMFVVSIASKEESMIGFEVVCDVHSRQERFIILFEFSQTT